METRLTVYRALSVEAGNEVKRRPRVHTILTGKVERRWKRGNPYRSSMLEATIGHMKNDGMLSRCHLKGKEGDAIHALLCGLGHNLRLLLNFIRASAANGFIWPLFWLLYGSKRVIRGPKVCHSVSLSLL